MRARILTLGILALLLGGAGPRAAHAAETGIVPAFKQSVDGPGQAADLGVGWVRVFVNWSLTEPRDDEYDAYYIGEYRRTVAGYHARGIKVLTVVTASPTWASNTGSNIAPPTDPTKYADFIGHMMDQRQGVEAWEIWNEPDRDEFWLDGPQPDLYAALLRATYPVIKARDPKALVVTGGTVGNSYGFVQSIYDQGAGGFFDVVATHTDTACLIDPPDSSYRAVDGRLGHTVFTGYREVHQVMAAHGDGAKPIWMTEIGWGTAKGGCRDGGADGSRPAGVTEAQQAEFLRRAFACLAPDAYVGVAFWFSLQDIPDFKLYAGHLGLVRTNRTRKPAYAAMKALRDGRGVTPDRSCGEVADRTAPRLAVRTPLEGGKFVDRLSIEALASDPGGAGMRRIELLADGKYIRSYKGSRALLAPWYRSEDLAIGLHTITVRAIDVAKNVTERSFTVEKVAAGQLPARKTATGLSLRRTRAHPRSVRVSARVSAAPGGEGLSGSALVVLEKRSTSPLGRRYWKRMRLEPVNVLRPAALTLRLTGAGQWRLHAKFAGSGAYRASRSGYRTFTVR